MMTTNFASRNKCTHGLWWVMAYIVMMLFPCCKNNKTNIHLSDLETREGIVLKKGEGVFTGKAWSSDNHTVCIECDTGRPISLLVYYDNGQVAAKVSLEGDNMFDPEMKGVFFDKKGNPIPDDEFLDSKDCVEAFQKATIYFREMGGS